MNLIRTLAAVAVLACGGWPIFMNSAYGELFVPQRGPRQTDRSWQDLLQSLRNYPCPVVTPPTNRLLTRMTDSPLELFLTAGWEGEEGDASLFFGQAEDLKVFRLLSQHNEQVHFSLALWTDAVIQMNQTIDYSYSMMSNSTRISTWSGNGDCFAVEGASFVAHHVFVPNLDPVVRPNSLFCGIYNAEIVLYSGPVRGFKDVGFPPDSFLVALANKFSSLFQDTGRLTLLPPPPGELTLNAAPAAPG